MPGVPPDALAQVKKGLKGLFGRKKRDKTHTATSASEASSSAAPASAPAQTSTPAAAAGVTPTIVGGAAATSSQPHGGPGSSVPQISEPANVEESKNIDLNPSAATGAETEGMKTLGEEKPIPKLEPKASAEGMSATSGPLSHDLEEGFGDGPGSPIKAKAEESVPQPAEAT